MFELGQNPERIPERRAGESEGKNVIPTTDGFEKFKRQLRKTEERMDLTKRVAEAIEEALKSSHIIEITLRPGAMSKAMYLLGMAESRSIKIDENCKGILTTAVNDGKFENDCRTIRIELTDKFDKKLFIRQLEGAIEEIKVINSSIS